MLAIYYVFLLHVFELHFLWKEWAKLMQEQFTFFWHGPFSQWHPSKFIGNTGSGILEFNCAEQWMMYKKAQLFDDQNSMTKIMSSSSPKEQKKLGRQVVGFDADKWNGVARNIVLIGNYYKFSQNPDLLALLKATGTTTLVEASPYDTVWGIGLAEDNPLALDRATWKGTNWLGEELTKLRNGLAVATADFTKPPNEHNIWLTDGVQQLPLY